jgi:hypothetical protein
MANKTHLTWWEKVSLAVTGVTFVVLCSLAWASSHNNWLLWLAVSVGGLGGLVHEVAQSGGKIAFFEKYEDGLYLAGNLHFDSRNREPRGSQPD